MSTGVALEGSTTTGQPLQRVDSDLERQVTTWFCHSLAVTWQLTVIIVGWSSFKKKIHDCLYSGFVFGGTVVKIHSFDEVEKRPLCSTSSLQLCQF